MKITLHFGISSIETDTDCLTVGQVVRLSRVRGSLWHDTRMLLVFAGPDKTKCTDDTPLVDGMVLYLELKTIPYA